MFPFPESSHLNQRHGLQAWCATPVWQNLPRAAEKTLIIGLAFLVLFCSPAMAGEQNPQSLEGLIASLVERLYPEYIVQQEAMMDAATRNWSYYRQLAGEGHPGIVCGRFRPRGDKDCAVLLTTRKNPEQGVAALYYVLNADTKHPLVFSVEHYEKEVWKLTTDGFLRLAGQGEYYDYEKDSAGSMTSDGFEVIFGDRISYGYHWKNNALIKIYTSN